MIGTDYTPELLASLAFEPNLRKVEVNVAPCGQEIAFYSRRYANDGGVYCVTTLFDADDNELATYEIDADPDIAKFGFAVEKVVSRVTVCNFSTRDELQAVFNVHRAGFDDVKVESALLHPGSVVALEAGVSEYGLTSVVEELFTRKGVTTSFYGDPTSDDVWLSIYEPAE